HRGVLGDHAPDRVTDECRAPDPEPVEHPLQILGPSLDRVRAGRLVAATGSALVVGDASVPALAAGGELAPPPVEGAPQPGGEDDGLLAPPARPVGGGGVP